MGFEIVPKSSTNRHGFVRYRPDNIDPNKHYPLLIFLHGVGGRGDGTAVGLEHLLTSGEIPQELKTAVTNKWLVKNVQYEFILYAPQTSGDWDEYSAHVQHVMDIALSNHQIDLARIYLTGMSMGGGGVWRYPSWSDANAKRIAAIVPVCPIAGWGTLCHIGNNKIGVWAFHASNDTVVSYAPTVNAVNAINACPLRGPVKAKMTLYDKGDHWIWGRVYSPNTAPGEANEAVTVYEWLLLNTLGNPAETPVVTPPSNNIVADAGPDVTLTGATTYTLDGSKSKNFGGSYWFLDKTEPSEIQWKYPTSNTTWAGSSGKLNISNLKTGKYYFRLVVQNFTDKAEDSMILTNLPAPAPAPVPVPPEKVLIAILKIYSDGSVEKTNQ